MTERISNGLVRLFGNSNERQIRRMQPVVARINELEPAMQALSDEDLKSKTAEFRRRLAGEETLDDILPGSVRRLPRGRAPDSSRCSTMTSGLVGSMVLNGGNIAEMVTGEGKTYSSSPPWRLIWTALPGKGVHVVTVNDYLASRDAEWMSPLYNGLTV